MKRTAQEKSQSPLAQSHQRAISTRTFGLAGGLFGLGILALNLVPQLKLHAVYAAPTPVAVYGIDADTNVLNWYGHKMFHRPHSWLNAGRPREIGSGWHMIAHALGGFRGDIFAIDWRGDLFFYEHQDPTRGAKSWSSWSGVPLEQNFGRFYWPHLLEKAPRYHVFSNPSRNILYGVQADGRLLAYRFRGFDQNNRGQWDTAWIGNNFAQYTAICALGQEILALSPLGHVDCFSHPFIVQHPTQKYRYIDIRRKVVKVSYHLIDQPNNGWYLDYESFFGLEYTLNSRHNVLYALTGNGELYRMDRPSRKSGSTIQVELVGVGFDRYRSVFISGNH